jgi:hypothetical protein
MTAAPPFFILGAGFGYDAKAAVGSARSPRDWPPNDDLGYPLVSDLWRICFPGEKPRAGTSIEARFQEAMQKYEARPVEALCNRLMISDYYLAWNLRGTQNCYVDFLQRFSGSSFLTFNYDSLVEILLLHLKRWSPADGYGVPVNVEYQWPECETEPAPTSSKQLVVHLHGTLCVFAEEYELVRHQGVTDPVLSEREDPRFHFAPDEIIGFPGYASVQPLIGAANELTDRVIAPVPDKTEGLTREFIERAYTCAERLLAGAGLVIAIGYSFNEHDRSSYERLVCALGRGAAVVVLAPDAPDICARLRKEYTWVFWRPLPKTFRKWADDGFEIRA